MNLIKHIIILFTLLASFGAIAQKDTAGIVFVSNDYREVASDAIVVKWVANKVYYPKGFDVYRQENGQTNWLKLTSTPLNVKQKVPTYLAARDPETETLLKYVNDMKYDEFQTNLIRVFVAIKSVESGVFAEALGVVYYDESAVEGKSYRYKVIGQTLTATETIHISPEISLGSFTPIDAPKNITTERKKKEIHLNWKVENDRYYGVTIHRKASNEKEFKKITNEVITVHKAENQKGELTYPKIFYVDHDIEKDLTYSYKLMAIDYFGNEGSMSKEVSLNVIDFDPPLPPIDVRADARLLGVEVKWKVQPVADLVGLNVYRHQHPGEVKQQRNQSLLSVTDTVFYEEVTKAGGYYYTIGALDSAGNEALSGEIFIDVHDLIPPAVPQNVRVTTDTGKVALRWDAVTDEDLWGYFIHRSLNDDNNEDNEFIILNKEPVLGTSYSEELNKKVKNKFVYKVVSVDSAYNRSAHSSLSVVQLPDVTPPQAPFIKNIHTDHNTIKLEWLLYHESDLLGFDLYRSSEEDSSNYSKVNKTTITSELTEYVDGGTIVGENYFYYLVALDEAGNVSKPSGVYKGKSDSGEGGKEASHHDELAVTKLKAKLIKKKTKAKISWVNPSKEFLGLVVYSGQIENDLQPISGKIKNTSFVVKQLKKGSTYYQVRTYDNQGHKSLSKVLKINIK